MIFHYERSIKMANLAPLRILFLLFTILLAASSSVQSAITATKAELKSGAVILAYDRNVQVNKEYLATIDTHLKVAILDDTAADDYSSISRSFNSHYSKLELISATVTLPDGRKFSVSADALQFKTTGDEGSYSDIRRLSFSLPSIKQDAIIDVHWRQTDLEPLFGGHWTDRWFIRWFQRAERIAGIRVDPVRKASLTLTTAQNISFKEKILNQPRRGFKKKRLSKNQVYYEFRELPEQRIEKSSVKWVDNQIHLLFSTMSDWTAMDRWADDEYTAKISTSGKLARLAKQLTKSSASRSDKVRKAFYYLQKNIRYIAADVSRGGLLPHSASKVLENQYGDCKDQSMLLVSLLRSMGIQAYPALIGTPGDLSLQKDLALSYFSHMIVYVPDVGGGIWMDTAGNTGQFPGLSSAIEGRQAFILDGKGGEIRRLPIALPEQNALLVDYQFAVESHNLVAKVKIKAKGKISNNLKAVVALGEDASKDIEARIERMFAHSKIVSTSYSDVDDPEQPFSATMHVMFKLDKDADKHERFTFHLKLSNLLTAFGRPYLDLETDEGRSQDYRLGGPLRLTLRAHTVPLQKGMAVTVQERPESYRGENFSLLSEVDRKGAEVTVTYDLRIAKESISARTFNSFVKRFNEKKAKTSTRIIYAVDEYRAKKYVLEKGLDGGKDRDAVVRLIHHHLEVGEFDEALALAKEGVASRATDGELHYLLGISLGFQDQDEASEQAIEKAINLGYEP